MSNPTTPTAMTPEQVTLRCKNLIHLYIDGDQWCAIYPMFSDIMSCTAIAFSPIRWTKNHEGRDVERGKFDVLAKIKSENPNLPTHSYYCEK